MSVSLTSTSTTTTLSSNGVDVFLVGSDNEAQVRVNGVMQPLSSLTSIGIGQTWQDVTTSRSLGTIYTNTTGRPIAFTVSLAYAVGGSSVTISVNGISFGLDTAPANMNSLRGAFIVPIGATYSVTNNSGVTLNKWVELRT